MARPALDRAALAALIPHRDAMCLLDRVSAWTDDSITCTANNHRDPLHPLRVGDTLPALCAIEYGAQAMAVHGGLLAARAGTHATPGVLAAVRDLALHCARLDQLDAPLVIHAERVMGDARSLSYAFSVRSGAVPVASGRAMVMLNPAGE